MLCILCMTRAYNNSFREEGMQLCNHRNFSMLLFLEHVLQALLACAHATLLFLVTLKNFDVYIATVGLDPAASLNQSQ